MEGKLTKVAALQLSGTGKRGTCGAGVDKQ